MSVILTASKYLAVGLASLICAAIGLIVLAIGLFYGGVAIADVARARAVFGPFHGIERVVASKRWHRSDEIFGCTYAVVELTPQRTAELAAEGAFRKVFGEQAMFWEHPGRWRSTPYNLFPRDGCYFEGMSEADKQQILEGLNEPGGWVGTDVEVSVFFLPKRNLIGLIRDGD